MRMKFTPCKDAPLRIQRCINAHQHWAKRCHAIVIAYDYNCTWLNSASPVWSMRAHGMDWPTIFRWIHASRWCRRIHAILAREEETAYGRMEVA